MTTSGLRPSILKNKPKTDGTGGGSHLQRTLSLGKHTTVNEARRIAGEVVTTRPVSATAAVAAANVKESDCNGQLYTSGSDTVKNPPHNSQHKRHTSTHILPHTRTRPQAQATGGAVGSNGTITADLRHTRHGSSGGGGDVRSSSTSSSGRLRRHKSESSNGNPRGMGVKNMAQQQNSDKQNDVQTVEILKRPGQSLGFYIREGNGSDRTDGVFISRIGPGSVVENNGLLHVGDEILTINSVDIGRIGLDDVVILMSIPKRLVLTIRPYRGSKNASCPSLCTLQPEETPVYVKKGRSSSATAVEMTEKCPDEFLTAQRDSKGAYTKMAPGYIQKLEETRRSRFGSPTQMSSGSGGSCSSSSYKPHNMHYQRQHPHQPVHADDSGDSGLSSENSGYSHRTGEGSSQGSQSVTTPGGADMLDRAVDDIEGMSVPLGSRSPRLSPHQMENGPLSSSGLGYRSPAMMRRDHSHTQSMPPAISQYQHDYASDIEHSSYDTYTTRRYDYNGHNYAQKPPYHDSNSLKAFQDEIERTHSKYEGYMNNRHKTGKTRSASPDCYNSDTEVVYRNSGPHGLRNTFSPRDSQLQHLMQSDSESGRCHSLPRDKHNNRAHTPTHQPQRGGITGAASRGGGCAGAHNDTGSSLASVVGSDGGDGILSSTTSGGDEIKHWLKKFDTWSNELKAEEHRQNSAGTSAGAFMGVSSLTMGRPGSSINRSTLASSPSATGGDGAAPGSSGGSDEYYTWLSNRQLQLAQRTAEFRPSRSNHANTLGHGRVTRKHSADSLMDYKTYQLDDATDLSIMHQNNTGGGSSQRYSAPVGSGMVGASTSASTSAHGSGKISHSYTSLNSLPSSITGGGGHGASRAARDADAGRNMTPPSSRLRDLQLSRKPVTVRVEDYKLYQPEVENRRVPVDRPLEGVLHVHVLCGHGLKSSRTMLRDLYCVIEVDSLNKARTMIRTGAINFDWDEAFDIDLDGAAREVSFLVYSWDPNTRHRLCFSGLIILQCLLQYGSSQRIGLKLEPKGILYLDIQYREAAAALQRTPSLRKSAMFGVDLQTIVNREKSGSVVPLLVRMCIEEVERRGLDHVGIYRLCGAARRKAQLRAEFENSARSVDLSPESVSDINVITGVLKDFLRELPEPLFTNALYKTLLDGLSVRIPQDPGGSARLMLGILDCLPKPNQETLLLLLEHLKRVSHKAEVNKMTTHNLAICFGPVLLCPSPSSATDIEAVMDFKRHVDVLHYLLDIWPEIREAAYEARTSTTHKQSSLGYG